MRKVLGVGFWVLGMLALSGSAFGQTNSEDNYGSLFPKNYKNPLIDRTARNVGDILTVVVIENASSNLSGSTNATKKDSNKVNLPVVGALALPVIGRILNNLGSDANSTVSGQGSTTNTSQLTAKISVMVKEVLPNGNMVVEGTRWVKVNREETNLTFCGIVRRDDVRADNTVLSENVADAKITNVSKGLIAERQRKGFITRLLDWLF